MSSGDQGAADWEVSHSAAPVRYGAHTVAAAARLSLIVDAAPRSTMSTGMTRVGDVSVWRCSRVWMSTAAGWSAGHEWCGGWRV